MKPWERWGLEGLIPGPIGCVMEIQDLKRWQWALIGLVGGLILGLAYRYVYTDFDPGLPTLGQPEMLAPLMVQQDFATGRPIIDNVVVYPLSDGDARAQLVTFKMRQVYHFRDPQSGAMFTRTRWEPRQIWAEIPFDPAGPPGNTLGDRLAELGRQELMDGADPGTAWWRAPLPGTLLFAAGGVLLLGGVWPSVLAVLVGAGFGSRKAKEEYDLSRFNGAPEEDAAAKPGVTAEDMDELDRLNASLEQSSAGEPDASGDGQAGGKSSESEQKRTLVADDPVHARADDDKPRDYQGEWYPVARKGK